MHPIEARHNIQSDDDKLSSDARGLLERDLRRAILDAAAERATVPDPAASISLEGIASQMQRPLSSVLYQFGDADGEAAAVFRRRAYVRATERFETEIAPTTHRQIIDSLRVNTSLGQDVAAIADAILEQLLNDPATRLLFAAQARIATHPELESTADRLWFTLSTNAIKAIELVAALRETDIGIARAEFHSLVRLALAAGWIERKTSDTRSTLEFTDAKMSVAAAVLWSGVSAHIDRQPR